ncbi:MAG TPA: type II toxin-antitoxin system mRNA interferase toxin, RelE/StbE family [Candidatus Woesebacteria bacterium]|nr:type II toxin-antitoxin system mRNA interferase toxin, RelE/StbE family [Candidatus Shapirobacteria bacterium]HOR02204.1 type II toxin-antitoxin system mRNA interferase toxin, RelE/StbE family [Candidatus Woesebacteria bacterium]
MKIYLSSNFLKEYKKVSKLIKNKLEVKEKIFRTNPFDPCLKTHPLTGKLKGFYSFSIDYHYRIVFSFENENEIWFHSIGTHAIYK